MEQINVSKYEEKNSLYQEKADAPNIDLTTDINGALTNGVDTNKITATVSDAQGQPLKNVSITWSSKSTTLKFINGNNTLTDNNGQASISFTDNVQETVLIIATCNGATSFISTDFVAQGVFKIIPVAGDQSYFFVDGSNTLPLVVKIVNIQTNQPAVGATVSWLSKTPGTGVLKDKSTVTDSNGEAKNLVYADPKAGTTAGGVYIEASAVGSTLGLHLACVTPLADLVILNANASDNYTLDSFDINSNPTAGIEVRVPVYQNWKNGDMVTFHWGQYSRQIFVESSPNNLPYIFKFKSMLDPAASQAGVYNTYYTATDDAGNISGCAKKLVTIVDTVPASLLPMPQVFAGTEALPYNAQINILNYNSTIYYKMLGSMIAPGNQITIYMKAYDNLGNPIADANYTHNDTINDKLYQGSIPSVNFTLQDKSGYEGYIQLYYTITQPTGDNTVYTSQKWMAQIDTVNV